MHKIVTTAQVEDYTSWEKSFRTHADLFRSMSSSGTVSYGKTDGNQVVVYSEVDDLAKYMDVLKSDTTAQAMAKDGVKRDTVKVYVLDGEFKF